ncbi:MAG: hypothetical protein JO122_04890 [Acetobacteraceae bacterium]|nr:hypothetical protein [Acetobacteraceae bacterium]
MRYVREAALVAGMAAVATGAHAADSCSNATLKGSYAFSIQGQSLGVLQGTTVVPFPSPLPTNGVALTVFDGNGGLTQVDFVMRGGMSAATPSTPLTDNGFRANETGSYSVAEDCTGTELINFPDGSEIDLALVVGAAGNIIKTVVTRQHLSVIPGNPNCTSGCDLAPQISSEAVKVSRGE